MEVWVNIYGTTVLDLKCLVFEPFASRQSQDSIFNSNVYISYISLDTILGESKIPVYRIFGLKVRLKSCTNFCNVRGQLLLSLKICDAKSTSLLRCLAIDRDTIGKVLFTFIHNTCT